MNIAIIGMGLIGGSLARTIKLHTEHRVLAFDIDEATMAQASLLEAYDEPLTDESLGTCELVLVALYPAATVDWLRTHAGLIREGALVIDCAGVKRFVVDGIADLLPTVPWQYIGGHPMAGREFSGFRYTRDDMFDRASMILVPPEDTPLETLQAARNFFLDIGFRRVQFATPEEHDEMIAYTSQLAHIVSSAYVKCPLADKHRGFSAGSFADMTRVARLNEDMWTELFFENSDKLLPEVSGLVDRLAAYRDALSAGDKEAMLALLREGRETKERLSE